MPSWVAATVAVSLIVIALCIVGLTAVVFVMLREAKERGESLAKEVGRLRADLAPTLDAIKRLGEKGVDVIGLAQEEATMIIDTTRRIRYDIERGARHARRRLADFDAVVEVVQEEIDAAAIDVTAALRTARTGAGMIGQLRRLVRPRRRGAA